MGKSFFCSLAGLCSLQLYVDADLLSKMAENGSSHLFRAKGAGGERMALSHLWLVLLFGTRLSLNKVYIHVIYSFACSCLLVPSIAMKRSPFTL